MRPLQPAKGDRLLEDSGLHLQRPPRPPAPVLFIHLATPTIPQIWQQYLPGSTTAACVGFTCVVCGEAHAGDTRDIRMGLPEPIFRIEEDEREERAWVGEDRRCSAARADRSS